METNDAHLPVWENKPNQSLFQDIFGQATFETLPLAARWLINLIPEKEFQTNVMPMMKMGNLALPALAVIIRHAVNLPETYQDYISLLAAQIRRAINERGKDGGLDKGALALEDVKQTSAESLTMNIGSLILLLEAGLQKKFFANFNEVTDENRRRQLLHYRFSLPAGADDKKMLSEPILAMKEVESLAALSTPDFLAWVENMIKKEEPKRDPLAEIGDSLKSGLEKYRQALTGSVEKQNQLIAELRKKRQARREKVLKKPITWRQKLCYPFKRIWYHLKGY